MKELGFILNLNQLFIIATRRFLLAAHHHILLSFTVPIKYKERCPWVHAHNASPAVLLFLKFFFLFFDAVKMQKSKIAF